MLNKKESILFNQKQNKTNSCQCGKKKKLTKTNGNYKNLRQDTKQDEIYYSY